MADLLVLDSASLYYRSFYALPESMTAPDGHPHNAVRGFLSTVARLVERHRPAAIVCAWDADWRPQWRVDLLPSYKAHRVADSGSDSVATAAEEEPESLGPQVDALARLLDALGIPRWGVEGFEADDVVASVCAASALPSIAVSGDRDLVQVVDERTRLLLAVNGGMEKWPLLGPQEAHARFGVPPERYVDLAVLRGDPSDGIPGVPGIGAKTAAALVDSFGDVEGILSAAAQDPRKPLTARLAGLLVEHAGAVRAMRLVATAVTDVPLPAPVPTTLEIDGQAAGPLASQWGVARQVDDLVTSLRQAPVPE